LEILIDNSKVMPITGSLMVDKSKLIELVDQLRLGIPQEVRAAEEVLSQKDQIMNNAMADARRAKAKAEDEFSKKLTQSELQRKADQILEDAQERAARILNLAEAEAESRRTEADAYALRSLRALEREVNSISGSVRKGIDMLAGSTLAGTAMSNGYMNED
jgi:cell division septum initiation protein DivIVA